MSKRWPFLLVVVLCFCSSFSFAQQRELKTLTERTQLRPVAWKADSKLWFAPGAYWVDGFEGGVQSGTLDETVELQIWNTTARMRFAPGFIRFERSAGGVKEGVLEKATSVCVVNTAGPSKLSLEFDGAPSTIEFGYDGCAMKGTLAKEASLRMWNGESKTFPAGSTVEFNGAGEVIRGVAASGEATALDGVYLGTLQLSCSATWLDSTMRAVPFNFVARGGALSGGFDEPPYSLQWKGNYDGAGKITTGMMTGWIDFKALRDPHEYGPAFDPRDKLRWTITGSITGTLASPAGGTVETFTVVAPDRPQITCSGAWSARKAPKLNITPTVDGTVIPVKAGAAGSLDLIFVIDQTSSMGPVFEQVQKTAKQIMASITAAFPDYRVAIVAYRDWGDTDMFKDFGFTTSASEFQAAIDSLKAQGGGDTPEAVLEALLRALRMPWRAGVNKQIILMGDAPPHSPVPQGPDMGKTADDVVKLAFEVDPAIINSIATAAGGSVSKDTLKAFEDLSMRTKGAAVTADKAEEVPKKIMDLVGTIAPPSAPAGGGGGAPVLPETGSNTAVIIAVILIGACVLLGVAIVVVRQRGTMPGSRPASAAGPKVNAGLSISFGDGRSAQFRITGTRTTIGRGPDNALVLSDGEASTHHAEISASREGFRLRDVGSANGTTVNGQPVTDADLRVGDEIGIGTTRLTLTL